ncbi:MAG: hydrolase [Zetaproteobacteria bacterium CG1_02_53_45]|nr:MAG: hydrolase [Zetaproteobacteria bacterium CG1_02_53_45]
MASFQTHIAVAAVGSLTASAVCLETGLLNQPQALALFSLGILAGILPDIDSDHSIPTRLVFTILSFAVAISAILIFQGQLSLLYLLGLALTGALFVRFIVYALFARMTEHRGLFHSLPAALIFGLGAFSLAYYLLGLTLNLAWLTAAYVSAGYLLHLLLDELYSVNFIGLSMKKSFGSALTLFSHSSWFAYLLMYAALGLAFYLLPLPYGLVSA